jgi:hypothetical protein
MKMDAPMETTGLLGHLRTETYTQRLCRAACPVNERRSDLFFFNWRAGTKAAAGFCTRKMGNFAQF